MREFNKLIAQTAQTVQRILRFLDGRHRAKPFVSAVQAGICPRDRGEKLLSVAQDIAAGKERFFLPLLQLRALKLADLMTQHIDAARLLRFIHSERIDGTARLFHHVIARTVRCQLIFHAAKSVKIDKVLLFVEQLLPVVLAVDIKQTRANALELRHRHRPSTHTADVFPVSVQLALQKERSVLFRGKPIFCKSRKLCRNRAERRADERFFRACADQLARRALPEHRAERVDHDGFTCAGLARECVESTAEQNVCPLNDGDILNVQKLKHRSFSCKLTLLTWSGAASACPRSPRRARPQTHSHASRSAPCRRPPPCRPWKRSPFRRTPRRPRGQDRTSS